MATRTAEIVPKSPVMPSAVLREEACIMTIPDAAKHTCAPDRPKRCLRPVLIKCTIWVYSSQAAQVGRTNKKLHFVARDTRPSAQLFHHGRIFLNGLADFGNGSVDFVQARNLFPERKTDLLLLKFMYEIQIISPLKV